MSDLTRALLAEIRADDIDHDPWGTAMAWHFAIADSIDPYGPPYVPASWGYRQALGGPDEDAPEYETVQQLIATEDVHTVARDLIYVGNVLLRFERVCELKGKSY